MSIIELHTKDLKVQDEFEGVLLAELEELRKSEKALQKMYPRLRTKPQLRPRFLELLAETQQRAYRLDGVLNPIGALHFAAPVPAPVQSSVA
jgi:ferritin-like metal-binding protein YciE